MKISLSNSDLGKIFKFFTELTVDQQAWFIREQIIIINNWYGGTIKTEGFEGVKNLSLSKIEKNSNALNDFFQVCWCVRKVLPTSPPLQLYRATKVSPGDTGKKKLVEGQKVKFASSRSTLTSWSDQIDGVHNFLKSIRDSRKRYIILEYESPNSSHIFYTHEQMARWLNVISSGDFTKKLYAYIGKQSTKSDKLVEILAKAPELNIKERRSLFTNLAQIQISKMFTQARKCVNSVYFTDEKETLVYIPKGERISVKIVEILANEKKRK